MVRLVLVIMEETGLDWVRLVENKDFITVSKVIQDSMTMETVTVNMSPSWWSKRMSIYRLQPHPSLEEQTPTLDTDALPPPLQISSKPSHLEV